MKLRSLYVLGTLALLALPSCSGRKPTDPPVLYYGADPCAECGMIISDQKFAAVWIGPGNDGPYTVAKFDDIGCLLNYQQSHPANPAARYIKDYTTTQWLPVGQAFYVHSEHIFSPMAYGAAALDSKSQALVVADQVDGKILDIEQMITLVRQDELRVNPTNQQTPP